MKLTLQGMQQFRAALRRLPDDLLEHGGQIVEAHAQDAQHSIVHRYPEHTGRLKAGVTLRKQHGKYVTSAIVQSRAPHAHLFEKGTKQRRTASGANRGRMPKANEAEAMIPEVIRKRRQMMSALVAMLRNAGFSVETT